jgi:hypothetical protein
MKRQLIVPALIVVGLSLLLLGLQWSRIVPTNAYWSADQGAEFMAAQADLHSKIDKHGDQRIHQRDLEAAKERFLKINSQLESARRSQGYAGTALKALGLLAVICGIGLHFAGGTES